MGSFRLVAGNWHLHQYNNFAGWAVETAPKSLRHSCFGKQSLFLLCESPLTGLPLFKKLGVYGAEFP